MRRETKKESIAIASISGNMAQVRKREARPIKRRDKVPRCPIRSVRRRRHDQRDGSRDQQQGKQMEHLLWFRKALKARVKDGDKLKAKQRLDARQHHPGFLDHDPGFFFKRRRSSTRGFVF
jgi:hypothetical protein